MVLPTIYRIARKCTVGLFGVLLFAPAVGYAEERSPTNQVVPLTSQELYQGARASDILGKSVLSNDTRSIGTVRNIVIGYDGQIKALIVEGGAAEFAYRVPRNKIDLRQLPVKIIADVPAGAERKLPLFGDNATREEEFLVSEVIGDYARLQPGYAFGYVSDVIFSPAGRMLAVLVIRDTAGGGGTFAFGFPANIGKWSPSAGYYGLPYVTADQARGAAIRVDLKEFNKTRD